MKLLNEEEIKELSRLHTVEEFKEFLKKKTEDLSEEDLEMAGGGIGEMNDAMKSYANIVIRSCKDSGMTMEDWTPSRRIKYNLTKTGMKIFLNSEQKFM